MRLACGLAGQWNKASWRCCGSGLSGCVWVDAWITDIFSGFCLPLTSSYSQKLARNLCCFAKQNGSLGYLKTTPFPCVGFCSDELIEETPGGRERGVCLLGKIVRSTEESEAWFLALELPGWEGLLYLSYNQLPSRDRAALASVVTNRRASLNICSVKTPGLFSSPWTWRNIPNDDWGRQNETEFDLKEIKWVVFTDIRVCGMKLIPVADLTTPAGKGPEDRWH